MNANVIPCMQVRIQDIHVCTLITSAKPEVPKLRPG